jgi:o-succinylbenzoate synthase
MVCTWEFRCYQRPIQPPLQTQHGVWSVREGVILRFQSLESPQQIGFGEIAPIPWFGTETLAEAITLCQSLPAQLTWSEIAAIPSSFPACQFGFASAWQQLSSQTTEASTQLTYAGLLPTGAEALTVWPTLWRQGYRTLKWKIAVHTIAKEMTIFQQLCQELPPEAKLRLDANGGLDSTTLQQWLTVCTPERVEFIEQPLPVEDFATLQALSQATPIPLALDESVATFTQLQTCHQQGWREIFVIKPAILGFPHLLEQFCQTEGVDVVFSSALETTIGRQASLNLAKRFGNPSRAVGFGINHWFKDSTHGQTAEAFWQGLQRS